jgi:Domain of unknown function (DUF4382)
MNHTKTLFLLVTLVALSMTACSGLGDSGGVVPPPVTGNATLSITLQAKPLAPPPNTNILSYSLTIGGITLTPASGSGNPINIPGSTTLDLTRLQSDSAFLGTISAPAGTYTSLTLSFTDATVAFCTQTAGLAGCTTGSVQQITGGATAPVITFPNGGLVLTSNQQAGLSVDFDMGGTLTIPTPANQVVSAVNLSNANLTTITLGPSNPSSLTSTQLDFLEDISGNVSVTGNQVTVKTATHGTITATADSNTFFSPNCNLPGIGDGSNTIKCVQNNQVASINAILNADGTIELIAYDPFPSISTTNTDWIEGIVVFAPSNPSQFTIIANDVDTSSSGSLLPTSFPIASTINVTLGNNVTPFTVDTQGLLIPTNNFQNATDTSVLLPGQTVAVHVTAFTAGSPATVTADTLALRFTRVAGTAAQNGSTTGFSLSSSSLPTFFGFSTAQQLVQLTSGTPPSNNSTNFDGITGPTSITSGNTNSIRALFFGQLNSFPFVAAKVRQNH